MTDIVTAGASPTRSPFYARFSSRLRAILLDSIIFFVAMAASLWIASTVQSGEFSRPLGVAFVCLVLLYEPVLVSLTGGTIGHWMTNLRVVDDRHGGNVSFSKALARVLIKTVLGWFSFLIMMATRRNQAVHDLLTKSTVQMRDASQAKARDFVLERVESAETRMPPAWRRLIVIAGYLIVLFVTLNVVLNVLVPYRLMSARCVNEGTCTPSENIILTVVGAGFLIGVAFCIGLGWRGRLFGARKSIAS